MPTGKKVKGAGAERERFHFAIAKWSCDYGVHINRSKQLNDLLGLCWESHSLVLEGPLRSKTRRRVSQVELTISPGLPDPETWKSEWKGFGGVSSVRDGCLRASRRVRNLAFHSLFLSLMANKTRYCTIEVEETRTVGDG